MYVTDSILSNIEKENLGLAFANNIEPVLEAFKDTSHLLHWDSKGHSGLAYRLGRCKTTCFDFKSKKQSLVTRSTTDAETYVIDRDCHKIEGFVS